MTRFVTSLFLAVLLIDIASAVHVTPDGDAHEPPRGVRRVIEMLENKESGARRCALAARERGMAIHDGTRRSGACSVG